MIIDDRLLGGTGASDERGEAGSEHLGPDWAELAQIDTEAEPEPTVPSPAGAPGNKGAVIDSTARDLLPGHRSHIPLLTAEQEVTLAKALS